MKNCEGAAKKSGWIAMTFRNGIVMNPGNEKPPGRGSTRGLTRGPAFGQALKLEPQPHVDLALGFTNLNPAPCRPST